MLCQDAVEGIIAAKREWRVLGYPMVFADEKQITQGRGGRILTNCSVWSPDGQWIVYDTRSDAEGAVFDGTKIEMVNVQTGEIRRPYESQRGAHCGVATFHPQEDKVVFILGPEDPTPDWPYAPSHRQGVIVDIHHPWVAVNIDARDLTPPLTPGALRGGSHVHVFSPDGQGISFTYNDALLVRFTEPGDDYDTDQRNVGVGVPTAPVHVSQGHPRNHDGTYFTVLVTRTTDRPRPGSDDITQALEEGWVGRDGYLRPDGSRQQWALAFQGQVMSQDGMPFWEVFIADLPGDVTEPSPDGPLEGTLARRPTPPHGTRQRRLTHTEAAEYPGISGPRHWLRTSPDGKQIAFLMRDAAGNAQLWTVSPNGGPLRQITHDVWGVASAFTWSLDGQTIAYAANNSVFIVEAAAGRSRRLTPRTADADAPLALACVFSPDGRRVAFLRRLADGPEPDAARSNQICVVTLPDL
jgi:hypothetical protein